MADAVIEAIVSLPKPPPFISLVSMRDNGAADKPKYRRWENA
jgi:hypothetical protein